VLTVFAIPLKGDLGDTRMTNSGYDW
jgi:hypothetical protein